MTQEQSTPEVEPSETSPTSDHTSLRGARRFVLRGVMVVVATALATLFSWQWGVRRVPEGTVTDPTWTPTMTLATITAVVVVLSLALLVHGDGSGGEQ